jgi:hypothetical protein
MDKVYSVVRVESYYEKISAYNNMFETGLIPIQGIVKIISINGNDKITPIYVRCLNLRKFYLYKAEEISVIYLTEKDYVGEEDVMKILEKCN